METFITKTPVFSDHENVDFILIYEIFPKIWDNSRVFRRFLLFVKSMIFVERNAFCIWLVNEVLILFRLYQKLREHFKEAVTLDIILVFILRKIKNYKKSSSNRITRSRYLQMFYKIGFLKIFAKFTGKQLCRNLAFNEVAGWKNS